MYISLIIVAILILSYPVYYITTKFIRILILESQIIVGVLNVNDNLIDKVKRHNQIVSYSIFILMFVGLTYLQSYFDLAAYDLRNKNLIEVLGLSLAILSLYGIYIGFLQFLTDRNEGNLFLGKSKVNYLIGRSIWNRMTQTNLFFVTLLLTIIIPIFVKSDISMLMISSDQIILELTYIWQTTVVILLLLYTFLLKMSLETISITLQMKTGSDTGLQYTIKKKIANDYERAFWKNYEWQSDCPDLLEKMLRRDIKKLNPKEIEEYIETVFCNINRPFYFKNIEGIWNKGKGKDFENFYINYLENRWTFLVQQINHISFSVWREQLLADFQNVEFFEQKFEKKLMISEDRYLGGKIVSNFLYDQLLKKSDSNLQVIIEDAQRSTNSLRLWNYSEMDVDQVKFEKYKWKQIFTYYEHLYSDVKLPKPRKMINPNYWKTNSTHDQEMDLNYFDIYSQACFDFLNEKYGKISEDIQSNQFLKSMLLSMNNEYLIAYSLYQLLYPNYSDWKVNFTFFDNNLKRLLDQSEGEECEYYYWCAMDLLLKTNISHRITKEFLDNLWNTRNDKIIDLEDWYSNFSANKNLSPFQLLYIQSIFSSSIVHEYNPRIDSKRISTAQDIILSVRTCKEYFQLLPNNRMFKEREEIKLIVIELMRQPKFDFSELLRVLELKSILYLENILKFDSFYKQCLQNHNVFMESIEQHVDNTTAYVFINTELIHFFVLKSSDRSYQQFFEEETFVDSLKYNVFRFLVNNDLRVEEYVDQLYKDLYTDEFIGISKMEKEQIIDKLRSIVLKY